MNAAMLDTELPPIDNEGLLDRVANVFDANVVWDNRPAVWPNTWEREPLWFRDLIAARLFPIILRRPVLVPQSSQAPKVLGLFEAAGMETATVFSTYEGEDERLNKITRFVEDGHRISVQTPAPYDSIPHCAYAIDRELITYLNNKRNLSFIAAPNAVLRRHLSSVPLLRKSCDVSTWPQALKACMSQPSMGGDEVFLCHTEEELRSALDKLHPTADVALEPWTPHSRNMVIQFLVEASGPAYLGATEQIIEESTKVVGNYIDSRETPPPAVISTARDCAALAGQLGYRGVVGFDTLISVDGERGWIIDANFRLNGSTTALLIYRSKLERRHQRWQMGYRDIAQDATEEMRSFTNDIKGGDKVPLAATLDIVSRTYRIGYMSAVDE